MLSFRVCPAGIKITALWLLLPGILLTPFIVWQSLGLGIVFCTLWAIISLILFPLRLSSFDASISLGELRVQHGVLFKLNHRIPTRFITGVSQIQTPLLRVTNCSFLIIYTSGTFILLPGIEKKVADQLIHIIHGGAL